MTAGRKVLGIDDNPIYRKVLEFIIQYKISHGGDSPTIRDLMLVVGNQSTSYTRWVLTKLVETGELEEASFTPRAIIVKDMQILYPIKLSEKYPEEGETVLARWSPNEEFIPASWHWEDEEHDEHEILPGRYESWEFLDIGTWEICASDSEPIEWIPRFSTKEKEDANNSSVI